MFFFVYKCFLLLCQQLAEISITKVASLRIFNYKCGTSKWYNMLKALQLSSIDTLKKACCEKLYKITYISDFFEQRCNPRRETLFFP